MITPALGEGAAPDPNAAWETPRATDVLVGEAAAAADAASALPVVAVSPNPFAGRTTLSFSVAEGSDARLSVYDVLGREVAVLVDGYVEAGAHEAVFEGRGLAAGTYFYRLMAGAKVQTGRMALTR